ISLLVTVLLHDTRAEQATAAGATPAHEPRLAAWLRLAATPELRMVFLATFLFGIGLAALFTFLAPYALASKRGEIGGFFFAYAMAAIITRIVGGRLPERLGPRRIL